MSIPEHVIAPPAVERRYIQTLAGFIRDLTADRGCQLSREDCTHIAERVMAWGLDVVEGTAPVSDPRDRAQLALANSRADVALHLNAARRSVGLNTRPQHTVRRLPDGSFVAVATACGMPLVQPDAGQRAEMARPAQ